MIIDECQKAFPVRGRGQPPAFIENLSTHRHLGLDFVLITQNPMLLDSFVRRLIDRHFHIVRKFGTHFATIHEFVNGCKDNVDKSRSGSIRHEWRYPKAVFDWYKSAEVHTVKRRVPAKVWLFLSLPLIFLVLAWFTYQRLKPDAVQNRINLAAGQPETNNKTGQGVNNSRSDGNKVISVSDYLEQYRPRIPDLPHTAPAYDHLTTPVSVPYPAGCIASKLRCNCYSQQGTALDMSQDLCKQITQKGFFVAWSLDSNGQRSSEMRSEPAAAPAPAAPQVVARADLPIQSPMVPRPSY